MLPFLPPVGLPWRASEADALRQQIAREIEAVRQGAACGEGPPFYRTIIMIPEWPPRRPTAVRAASVAAPAGRSAAAAAPARGRALE